MHEVTTLRGTEVLHAKNTSEVCGPPREISLASMATQAWNPSFNVTAAELIDGIITDKGVVEKGADGAFHLGSIFEREKNSGQVSSNGAVAPSSVNGHNAHPCDKAPAWAEVLNMKADKVKPWVEWMADLNKGKIKRVTDETYYFGHWTQFELCNFFAPAHSAL